MLSPVVTVRIKEFSQLFGPTQKIFEERLVLFRVVLASYKRKCDFITVNVKFVLPSALPTNMCL